MGQIGKVGTTPLSSVFENCDGRYYKTSETKGKWVKFLKMTPKLEVKSPLRPTKMPLPTTGRYNQSNFIHN